MGDGPFGEAREGEGGRGPSYFEDQSAGCFITSPFSNWETLSHLLPLQLLRWTHALFRVSTQGAGLPGGGTPGRSRVATVSLPGTPQG